MSVTKEMDVINKIVKDMTPLGAEARCKVIDVVCKILDIGQSQPPPPARGEVGQRPPAGTTHTGKPTAPQQYLRDYNYKIMTKRIAVLAVYLERERGMKRFNFKDITEAFRAAKEAKTPAPSQYARAVVMGYLAKEGDQYYATGKAEELIDSYNVGHAEETGGET
ncbi:MAG: hypothetical protein ACLPRE_01710 [Limisphaerales bacterium]